MRGTTGALAAVALLVLATPPLRAASIEVTTTELPAFDPGEPETDRFGALRFRGGLALESPSADLGGLSGIEVSEDGRSLLLATDTGRLVRARLELAEGRPTGLRDVAMVPLVDESGKPLGGKYGADAESLRGLPGHRLERVLIGFERDDRIVAYTVDAEGRPSAPRALDLPASVGDLPHNRGLESVAVTPDGETVVAFGESENEDGLIPGWLLAPDGQERGRVWLIATNGFSATDAVFLDTGDLVVLERRYGPLIGIAMRLRRIPAAELKPDALLAGEEMMTARMDKLVDNMEGIAFHREPDGTGVLTIVSDDNFNILQRNLLLQFELAD